MAHLDLVMIHPFRDGDGRMARCLQSLVLVREGILAPEFSSGERARPHRAAAHPVGASQPDPRERDCRLVLF
jgi:Fic family protein